jgi:uncharacterized protein
MNNRQFSQYFLVMFLLAFSTAGMTVEKISWDDLSPRLEIPRDQMAPKVSGASLQNRRDLFYLRNLVRQRSKGLESEEVSARERQAIASLEAGGLDAEGIIREMTRIERLRRANENKLVEAFNGRQIQIAGYLLPIEFSDDKVVEFLLVAEDGACVHTPVPPLNQLIHVTADEAFEIQGLFTPVVVSGVISTSSSHQSIAYSDGVLDVVAGYKMAASRVEAYEN